MTELTWAPEGTVPLIDNVAVSELKRKGYPVENLVRTAQRPDVTSAACEMLSAQRKNAAEAAFFSKR